METETRHSAGCGQPPSVVADLSKYFGYVENQHGEQWIVEYDRNTRQGTLRGGDVGWETVHEVIEGEAAGLILNLGERAWLLARCEPHAGRCQLSHP